MSYKAIIEVEGIERDILNFSIDYFIPNLWLTLDKNTMHWTMEDYRKIPLANKFSGKGKEPFGGLLNIVMESTSNDDFFWNWFNDDKVNKGIRTTQGEIRIYSADDEYFPMKRIEFWDCFVSTMSESFSSTGNSPMTLNMQLSPATVRFNKELVFKKSWWWTDIDQKQEPVQQEDREPFVERVFWKGSDYGTEREDIMLNHNLKMQIQLSDYIQGDQIELTVKQSNGRRIKGDNTEFTISGTCNEDGLVIIDNFKVECDFKEDNQNFGNIEFYHKKRKVQEFKENFGWTKIDIEGKTYIFVNIKISDNNFITPGCTLNEYLKEVSDCFNRTLQNSSGGQILGKLFFSGTFTPDPPQIVPGIYFGESDGGIELGRQTWGHVSVFNPSVEYYDHLLDLAETTVHELFHSLRLDHPFDKVQTIDTELVYREIEVERFILGKPRIIKDRAYYTTNQTDPNIIYNIMNYNSTMINGERVDKYWKFKRPEYLTKGQISFILNAIDEQIDGYGTDYKSPIPRSEYWEYIPGQDLKQKE